MSRMNIKSIEDIEDELMTSDQHLPMQTLYYVGHPDGRFTAADPQPVLQPAQQQCRTDGRYQYAIDSGAEGMGHCPKGKCVMSAQQQKPYVHVISGQTADELWLETGRLRSELADLKAQQQEPVAWRELCRRLYVELFHCDQQMMETLDEDGAPRWTQGKEVRDVLADAKAALDTSQQPAQQEPTLQEQLDDALQSLDFYRRRVEALQQWQGKMRDPERTIVCDIIANGHTLEPAGDRYKQPARKPQSE